MATGEHRPRSADAGARGPALTRRRWLELAFAAATFAAGGLVFLRRASDAVAPSDLQILSAWQWRVVRAAAARITAPDDPGDASIPRADDADVAAFVDRWLASARPRDARDFGRFLAFVEHVAPLGCGHLARFSGLSERGQDEVLRALQESPSDLLRAGFDGLRSLVFMGYYRDPRTWKILGYDGPFVGRPPGGWW